MNSTEKLDVVDADDRVIDARYRHDVHRLGLKHRAAHVLVFNRDGELFLQRRSPLKDVAPNLWDTSAAGHLDVGESYDSGAVRELQEELGICGVALEPLFKLEATAEVGWEFIWVYRCVTEQTPQLNAEEIAEGRWLTRVQLEDFLLTAPEQFTITFRLLWQQFSA